MDIGKKKKKKKVNSESTFNDQQANKVLEAYKRQGINPSSFSGFNQATDTITQGQSRMLNVASSIAQSNAQAAGLVSHVDQKVFRKPDGNYSVQRLYKKK
jgi:hypothetical protein